MVSRVLLLALVLMTVLAPALALAANNCVGMGADCGAPCGTTQGAIGDALIGEGVPRLDSTKTYIVLHKPTAPIRAVDPPPRLPSLAG